MRRELPHAHHPALRARESRADKDLSRLLSRKILKVRDHVHVTELGQVAASVPHLACFPMLLSPKVPQPFILPRGHTFVASA